MIKFMDIKIRPAQEEILFRALSVIFIFGAVAILSPCQAFVIL